jgi:c-di-AMP phosphodiesterase-like protein
MKIIKMIIILILNVFLIFSIFPTQEIEDAEKKIEYIRYFISISEVANEILKLINDNYIWISEGIFFGSLYENKYFNGQIQIIFNKNDKYKSINVDFIKYRSDERIEIKKIFLLDDYTGGGGYITQ